MEHYDRIAAAQGVFDADALAKIREAYTAVVKALDPDNRGPAKRAEIADALFYLSRHKPEMGSLELSIRILGDFSPSGSGEADGSDL